MIISCGEDGAFFIDYGGASTNNAEWRGAIFTNTAVHQGNFIGSKFGTRWIMFTMAYDGKSLKHFHNGNLYSAIPAAGTIRVSTDHYVLGQRQPGGKGYEGCLGEVLIYNRALSDEEVRHHFEATQARFPGE